MTALKAIALLATLLVSSLGLAPAAATNDMSPKGLEWKRVSENNLYMTAVAHAKGPKQSPVALLVQVSSDTFTTGVEQSQMRSDYTVRQVNFDCATRGRYRVWKNWSYRVGSDQPVKVHPLTDTWEVASSFSGPLEEWKIVCGEEAAESLTGRPSFDAITADYRARYAQKKAQGADAQQERVRLADERDAREMAAAAKAQLSPEIDLKRAAGEGNHHWHYVFATLNYMGALDVHRVMPGATPNLKRVSTALFTASPTKKSDPDYVLKFEEYDCSKPNRFRTLAGASYQKGGKLLVAYQDRATTTWATYPADNPMNRFWDWACKGDQKINALPANQGFDQMLESYRQQLQEAQ